MKAVSLLTAPLFISAGVLLSTVGASATIVKAEYTGTVSQGYDGGGLFSSPGSDLAGLSFVADFLYDTERGTWVEQSPTSNRLEGGPGTQSGGESPVLTASLEINGRTATFAPNDIGQILAKNGSSQGVNQQLIGTQDSANTQLIVGFGNNQGQASGDIPVTIDKPLTFTAGPDDTGSGDFVFANALTSGSLRPVTLTYSVVPEPGTWAMMLTGFAVLGLAGAVRVSRTAAKKVA